MLDLIIKGVRISGNCKVERGNNLLYADYGVTYKDDRYDGDDSDDNGRKDDDVVDDDEDDGNEDDDDDAVIIMMTSLEK
jgi:hypothetical protein